MKSPFPGMDPYLERHWEDVHTRLIGYIADAIQPQLADDLIARMEEKVYVEDGDDIRRRRPDIRVVQWPSKWSPESGTGSTAVANEPMILELMGDPIRVRSVLIYDSAGNRIITAIEILSPLNNMQKAAISKYLKNREQYINSEINLVEIDLVRAGDWTDMMNPYNVPPEAKMTYRVTVIEPESDGSSHYPISLRAKLPTIKVPLRPQEPPAVLNLQELIEKAYAMGRYDRIDYSKPCSPPLTGTDKEWAETIIKQAGIER